RHFGESGHRRRQRADPGAAAWRSTPAEEPARVRLLVLLGGFVFVWRAGGTPAASRSECRRMSSPAKKIMLVDDEPDIVLAVKTLLEDAGYTVVSPVNGEQLESLLAGEPPHLILLDMLLYGRDGRVITQQLKSQQATRNIPILMFSAHPTAAREA